MNDLLHRMVQRTLKLAPVIQPVPVSRYEPAWTASNDLLVLNEMRTDQYQPQLHVGKSIFHQAKTREEWPPQGIAERSSEQTTFSSLKEAEIANSAVLRSPAAETSANSHSTPQQYLEPSASLRTREQLHASRAQQIASHTEDNTKNPAHTPSLGRLKEDLSSPALIARQRLPKHQDTSIQHRQGLSPEDTGSHDQQMSAPVSAVNEINISIGHIEVRVPPAPEAARKSSFRPGLSLDSFLNNKKPGARS